MSDTKISELEQGSVEFPEWIKGKATKTTYGFIPEDFPIIYDRLSGKVFQPALLFLADCYLSKGGRYVVNTVGSYCDDILDYVRFCREVNLDWLAATWENLDDYVGIMEGNVSPVRREPYREGTVTRRLVPILGLYKWASRNLSLEMEVLSPGSLFLPRVIEKVYSENQKRRRESKPVEVRGDAAENVRIPRVLQRAEMDSLYARLGTDSEVFDCDKRTETSVFRLATYISHQSGLRLFEVVGLKVAQFQKFIGTTIHPLEMYPMHVKRKGGRTKLLHFHGVLVSKILAYVQKERESVMNGQFEHGYLLVNQSGATSAGRPVSRRNIQRRFTKACMDAGLVITVRKTHPTNGDWTNCRVEITEMARFSFHDLRHTFAVWAYYAMRSAGIEEPWKGIADQLGHEDVLTTIKTYLQCCRTFESYVSDKFVSSLNAMARVGSAEARIH
ncbi:tyrosine-type recombinase/integrase [Pelomonas sp. SE-A7]|uniref:tyrosine-type recombinase/integrase n=1 Tax=Pelomonas sp. SE-A7 TaxID=3054953 RepID=UPI00259C8161|nr:tyrosine-type recombinase/integrase [Pelomonas sp. SE-A7]MDM4765990.1 tyrosine-type recombinase/integrase [Pelomonas sp. SE-A7]